MGLFAGKCDFLVIFAAKNVIMTIQFKIQIRGIKKPSVWRRIVIPGNFTFHDLHNTIQSAFGWWDEHLYHFQRRPFDGGWTVKELDEEDDNWGELPEDARETNVLTFIQHMGLEKFVYVYDFGDSWVHDITVESIDKEADLDHPVCLAGKGACPPEDCGGPWGYEELKEEMDKDEINEFDLEEVNDELESITAGSEWLDDVVDSMWDEESDMPLDIQELEGKTLADLMENRYKGSLIDFAEDLGFDIDENISEEEYRKQYAQALKDNAVKVMSMLPMSELKLLEQLKKNHMPGNAQDCYEDYCSMLMVIYGLAGEWWNEDDNHYIWVPDDLWQMMKPQVEEVMADPHVQHRLAIESTIIGLANLYGQVSLAFVEKELVRLGQVQNIEGATVAVSACMADSLLLKFTRHQTGRLTDEPSEDTLLFLSRYGWDMPGELDDEIKKRESLAKDYRLFTLVEVMNAAVIPMPRIANPMHDTFFSLLTEDLKYNDWLASKICHDLWYREMHKYEEDFEEEDPGLYFREEVLYEYDSSDSLFRKAMKLLDDYLNNMPHWQLKGHTPMEVQGMLSEEGKAAKRKRQERKSYLDDDYISPKDWMANLGVTMPIIAEKKPGRNEPCPCGSGKKYKNCCGRGN